MSATASNILDLHVERGDPARVADFLATPGALRHGHYQLLSGLHSDRFLAFSAVAELPSALDELARWLSPSLAPHQPTAVLSPSTAGVGLGFRLAQALGVPFHLASLDEAGRPNGIIGAPDLADQRVVLVNDVVTTGQGLAALESVCVDRGGAAACAAWFMTRSDISVQEKIGLPCAAVCKLDLPAWAASECSLCQRVGQFEHALDLN